MPLITHSMTRNVARTLFAGTGALKSITLLKRNDDLQQGTVRAVKLFDCRKSFQTKTGQSIQGEMSSDHRCVWHIPRVQLDRAGVTYLNALDRIVEDKEDGGKKLVIPRQWQPESTTPITIKLFENEIDLECLRVDV